MIEAETSYEQTVWCSRGPCSDNLGRVLRNPEDKDFFDILDYDPDMNVLTKVVVESGAAVGIDDDGEIWILAGY